MLASSRDGLRLEAVSSDGAWVAYSEVPLEDSLRCGFTTCAGLRSNLYVVSSSGGPSQRLAENWPFGAARFVGTTLLVFESGWRWELPVGPEVDQSNRLLAWRPGDAGLTELAIFVDPNAVHASRDERWISAETDDLEGDGVLSLSLKLFDMQSLEARPVAVLSSARARFSRDSRWLFVSGFDLDTGRCGNLKWLAKLSLEDFSVTQIGCVSWSQRWELSGDGQWIVHTTSSDPPTLARLSVDGGSSIPIAAPVAQVSGKEFDLDKGSGRVAFLQEKTDGNLALAELDGSASRPLGQERAQRILEHFPSLVVFESAQIAAVSTQRDFVWAFGPAATGAWPSSRILDELDGIVLIRSAALQGSRLDPLNPVAATFEPGRLRDARALPDGRTLFNTAGGALKLYPLPNDAGLAESDTVELEGVLTGPFEVEPKRRRWYVVTLRTDDGSELQLAPIP